MPTIFVFDCSTENFDHHDSNTAIQKYVFFLIFVFVRRGIESENLAIESPN